MSSIPTPLQKIFNFLSPPQTIKNSQTVNEVDISILNILDTIEKIDLFPKVFFEDKDGFFKAGLGISDLPFGFQFFIGKYNWNPNLKKKHSALPDLFYPQIQIIQTSNETAKLRYKTLNHIPFQIKKDSYSKPFSANHIQNIKYSPDSHDWRKLFESIEWEKIEKVVPARLCQITLSETIDAYSFFKKIKKINHYNFLIQISSNEFFMGSSPERLLKYKNSQLLTEAVAGTRKKEHANELLESQKDQMEHLSVVRDISQKLSQFCTSIENSQKPFLHFTKNLAHLKSEFFSTPKNWSPVDWIHILSPTSAICGYPKDLALSILERFEPFQRGFYSAPLGYIDANECDIGVAIRSCYIHSHRIELFSGVGVISSSNSIEEWNELDIKIKPYMDLLSEQDKNEI